MTNKRRVYDFNSKPRYKFGQYQKQVSLLSGISINQIYDALSPSGLNIEIKKEDLSDGVDDGYNLRIDCSLDALNFSVSILSLSGDPMMNADELGIALQFNSFFSDEDLSEDTLQIINNWNIQDTMSKSYFAHGLIVLEMVLPTVGVVDETVNEGIYGWLEIVEDFHNFLNKFSTTEDDV